MLLGVEAGSVLGVVGLQDLDPNTLQNHNIVWVGQIQFSQIVEQQFFNHSPAIPVSVFCFVLFVCFLCVWFCFYCYGMLTSSKKTFVFFFVEKDSRIAKHIW